MLFPLLDVPLPTCTRWHGARMHDAQPVLTRLPALPITQGSAHASCLASRNVQASCPPKCRQHGEPGCTPQQCRSFCVRLVGCSCSRMPWRSAVSRCTRELRTVLRLVSGWAERSAPACEEPCCGWVRTHSHCTPVLKEGGRAELRQKVKVAFCRSFTGAYFTPRQRTPTRLYHDRESADTPTPIAARVPGEGISSPNTPKKRQKFSRGLRQPRLPGACLLYTSPSPRDQRGSRMPSSA